MYLFRKGRGRGREEGITWKYVYQQKFYFFVVCAMTICLVFWMSRNVLDSKLLPK